MRILGRKQLGLSVMLAAGALYCAGAVAGQVQEANKKTALAITKAMEEHDVAKASSYLRDDYIQHNPNVPTGKAGYVAFFTKLWPQGPKPEAKLANPPVFVVAQGDKVVLVFKTPTPDPTDASKTYDKFGFDAYRFENGKIAEHWDQYPKFGPSKAK